MAKKSAKNEKTNVCRLLDQAGIPYETHFYPHGDEAVDGATVASILNQPPERVFKTLVTRGAGKSGCFVFVIPVTAELNLKAAAKAVGVKSVEMLHVNELLGTTGYIRGGCSPVGMKKLFPTCIDQSALDQPTIMVSGGKIGIQVELEPKALAGLIGAQFAPLTMNAAGVSEETV